MTNSLFVAWQSSEPTKRQWGPVGRLDCGSGGYRFVYTRGARQMNGFAPFPGMLDLGTAYESDELFPLFANRLLARSRPEYEAFLTWSGFDPANPPDPIAVLGVTEGRRATDSLEVFPCPRPDSQGRYVSKFFLHGLRYAPAAALERIARLEKGEMLGLMLDVSNLVDEHAVAVRTCDVRERFLIGYVPRYLARDVGRLCRDCNTACAALLVDRINKDAPLQQRVLGRMEACWPDGFRPCATPDFEPIVEKLSPMAP